MHLQNTHHYHDTPRRVGLITTEWEIRRCLGGGLTQKSSHQWVAPGFVRLYAPWRSFRQLSRTRPAAVLNSSLQRPAPDEQLQHTGQFPYKSPLPPRSPSLTPPLRMPSGILTVLMNITPAPQHKHTRPDERSTMRSIYCPLEAQREAAKDNTAFETLALPQPPAAVGKLKAFAFRQCRIFPSDQRSGAGSAWEERITFKLKLRAQSDISGEEWGSRVCENQKKKNYKLLVQMHILNKDSGLKFSFSRILHWWHPGEHACYCEINFS